MNHSTSAALLLAAAVALGAFGAHGLKARLDAYSMGIWEKAVFYHFIHALGLLVVASWRRADTGLVCWLLTAGILLFSGSLYLLALTRVSGLGAITPLGGAAFIAAWLLLALRLSSSR
ncbi:MAG: DUF423 domain-containing protein [Bryobacterales bacterium]|nr:DUF423 domain-containing protein [Bryobacterales bacterium]